MGDWARRIEQRLKELAPEGKDAPGLARACEVQRSSVSGWFARGTKQTQMIRGDNLVAAARYLNTSPEWIMTGRDRPGNSQLQRPSSDMLQDAMGLLDELDAIMGRKPTLRPDPERLAIAIEVVAAGEIEGGAPVVVRLADRLRDLESKRGNESGQTARARAADGGTHGSGAAGKTGTSASRKR